MTTFRRRSIMAAVAVLAAATFQAQADCVGTPSAYTDTDRAFYDRLVVANSYKSSTYPTVSHDVAVRVLNFRRALFGGPCVGTTPCLPAPNWTAEELAVYDGIVAISMEGAPMATVLPPYGSIQAAFRIHWYAHDAMQKRKAAMVACVAPPVPVRVR